MTTVPGGWPTATLAEVCVVSPRDPALSADSPFIPMDAVKVGERWPTYLEERGSRGGIRARDGDVLFARITPCLENGKLAQVPDGAGRVGGSTEFIVIRPGLRIDPGYLYYWCMEPSVRADAMSNMAGVTGRMRLVAKELARFTIPVPSLDEQRRIVDILEDHSSRLDAGESGLVAAFGRAHALAIADAMWSLTGGVEAAGPDSINFGDRIVQVPHGWRGSTVGAEASLVQYGTSAKASEAREANSVPVLRMGNLLDGALIVNKLKYLPSDHPDVAALLLRKGDLLFNRTNSAELVGKSAIFDQADDSMTFASYLLRVRFCGAVRPEWANLVINSPLGRAHIATVASQQVGQANVNGTKLKAFPLLVPPLDVQERLLARHGWVMDGTRRLTADINRTRDHGRTLRRALLQAAFSGRLTGSSIDTEIIEELASV